MATETVTFTPPAGMTSAEFSARVLEMVPGASVEPDADEFRHEVIGLIGIMCHLYSGSYCNYGSEYSTECRLCRLVHGEEK